MRVIGMSGKDVAILAHLKDIVSSFFGGTGKNNQYPSNEILPSGT
jgi:hypothetical protein